MAVGNAAQVGVLDDGTIWFDTHQLAVSHRDEHQSPVGQPVEPRWSAVVFDLDLPNPVDADRGDRPLVEVAEPELAVMPTWPFAEVDAVDY